MAKKTVSKKSTAVVTADTSAKPNGLALAGFIIACASLLNLIELGFIGALTGIVLSIVGLEQIKKGKGQGKGFAIAGIIVGSVSMLKTCALVLGIIIYLIVYFGLWIGILAAIGAGVESGFLQ